MKYLFDTRTLRWQEAIVFLELNINLHQKKHYKINDLFFTGVFAELTENEMLYVIIKTSAIIMDHTHPDLKVAGEPANSQQRRIRWKLVNKSK